MLRKNRLKILALFFPIIGVICYTVYNEMTLKPFNFESVENNIDQIQANDINVNQAIVLARYGLLDQYDSINDSLDSLQKRINDFDSLSIDIKNSSVPNLIRNLKVALQLKRDMIEQFKTDDTILKIAILHFSNMLSKIIESESHEEVVESCLSGEFSYELTELTNRLYRDMLVYINTVDPDLKISLLATVAKLRTLQETTPELLNGLVYADLILKYEPKLDEIIKKIFDVKTMSALAELNTELKAVFDQYLQRANINRILLYLFSAILLGLLIWAFKRIQSTIEQLKAAQEDLRLVNQGLESRVKERTQQLTDKNIDLQKTLEKLSATQEQLVLQEKMASVGMLTAGISHELKNPLNFVNNFSEASVDLIKDLKEDFNRFYENPSEKSKKDIEELLADLDMNASKILEHGKRADKIVENMRLHSQSSLASRESTDINKLLEEQIDLAYHNTLAKNKDFKIHIIKNLDAKIGSISVIPQTMSRAILNILMNALYYLQKKEAFMRNEFHPELIVSTGKVANKVIITLHDNGMGIPENNIRKIFEPFFTTKPTGEGTGLGLSIAYDTIVKEHGGDIRVNSKEGEYAEFIIELPCQKKSG
jgi:signal transduction histidine kinase